MIIIEYLFGETHVIFKYLLEMIITNIPFYVNTSLGYKKDASTEDLNARTTIYMYIWYLLQLIVGGTSLAETHMSTGQQHYTLFSGLSHQCDQEINE